MVINCNLFLVLAHYALILCVQTNSSLFCIFGSSGSTVVFFVMDSNRNFQLVDNLYNLCGVWNCRFCMVFYNNWLA